MEDLLNVYVEGEFLTVSHQSAGTEISTPHSEYWAWMPLHWTGGEDNGLDPNNQAVLDRYVPASELMVSLHLPTLKQLSIFLHALLEKYGGWIGLDLNWVDDEGNSINVFTIDTVRDLPLVFD